MNPRQRRGALLLLLAAIGSIVVVFGVTAYVSDVQTQVGPMRTIVQLSGDIEQLEPIGPDDVDVVEVPERWAPEQALVSPDELAGLVAANPMPSGTVLQSASVTEPPQIETGEREMAVLVSPETGVGGKIQPGDTVDVYGTFDPQDGVSPPTSELLLQNLTIVGIASAVDAETDEEGGFGTATALPVTFAVTTEEALILAYAESYASEVRLGLRTPIDTGDVPGEARIYTRGVAPAEASPPDEE